MSNQDKSSWNKGGVATANDSGASAGSYGSGNENRSSGDSMQQTAMDKAQELGSATAEKMGEVGSKLHDTADMGVNRAAEGLDQASTQLREKASEMGGVQEKLGVRMADGLDKTSGYLREHEAQEIMTDVEKFVREHPMQAAVTAAVAGYVIAKVLK
jgi:ElaB/YqjD/DUF883 family membrane-anchored ribosome-binding protein